MADKRTIAMPDYDNIESTNRIDAVGSSWTATKTGYIQVQGRLTSGNDNIYFYVGNTRVCSVYTNYITQVVPVVKGQVVTCALTSGTAVNISCCFIPIKWVEVD